MQKINELKLAKELIRFPTVTPVDAGIMKFLGKNDKDQMSFIPIASTDAVTGRLKIITQ